MIERFNSKQDSLSQSRQTFFPVPGNSQEALSALIYLPQEIWQFIINHYLTPKESKPLLLTCAYFKHVLFNRQWLPYLNIQKYYDAGRTFNWVKRPIYGITFNDPESLLDKLQWKKDEHFFSNMLSADIEELDLSGSLTVFNETPDALFSMFKSLPKTIKKLTLQYSSNMTEDLLLNLLREHPQLEVSFQGRDMLCMSALQGFKAFLKEILEQIKIAEELEQKQTITGRGPYASLKLSAASYTAPGDVPLILATIHNHKDIVALLLKYGADVNAYGRSNQKTALHYACIYKHLPIIEMFLENKADLTRKDKEGHTPLHIACKAGDPAVVKKLLEYGAELTIKNVNGMTPLDLAQSDENKEVAAILIKALEEEQGQQHREFKRFKK